MADEERTPAEKKAAEMEADAERKKEIHDAAKKLEIPDTLRDGTVILGYSVEDAVAAFAKFNSEGHVRLSNDAGWGEPKT